MPGLSLTNAGEANTALFLYERRNHSGCRITAASLQMAVYIRQRSARDFATPKDVLNVLM